MQLLTDILRFSTSDPGRLWTVVGGALLLATLDAARQVRRARAYDAWWCFNVRA